MSRPIISLGGHPIGEQEEDSLRADERDMERRQQRRARRARNSGLQLSIAA